MRYAMGILAEGCYRKMRYCICSDSDIARAVAFSTKSQLP